MAKRILKVQQSIALALALLLCAPAAAFAADGKKHFKEGLKYEENHQWDRAAEQFALAVAEKPSNVEYQLHLQRALVSAGLMLVERGDGLAEKKDYDAAYNAYRQAYAFDPGNELALIKMRRMLEVQGLPTTDLPTGGDPSGPKLKPQSKDPNQQVFFSGSVGGLPASPVRIQLPSIPGRRFARTDVVYRDTNLLTAIEQLAQMMKLNVVPDQTVAAQLKQMRTTVELRDVTYPRALEILLKTNNLMYAQIDSRTIVIASDNPQSRMRYEPLAVRTFYIKNADIDQLKGALAGAMPQTKNITTVKQLNALIVRDSPANLEMVEQMINSLDKSKAEVLIDINIYEVSRNNLLQIGNQFGNTGAISTTGQLTPGSNLLGGFGRFGNEAGIVGGAARFAGGPLGLAIGLPASSLSVFQDKGKSKLLASTQVHVIDGEPHAIRIGQRVPIKTATIPTFGTSSGTGTGGTGTGNNGGTLAGFGIDQIQYESVGLNIDMTPTVFEDEVQMKMKIESSSVDSGSGGLTPTFNQRTMSSIARVKNGQATMIAGVSQNNESKNIKGLPLIGLIPILGRFFATPETKETQSDVIITVTPHILRRADILEDDHLARWAGDAQNSSNQLKIEQILYLADLQDSKDSPVAVGGPEPAKAVPEARPAPPNIVTTKAEPPGVVALPPPTSQLVPVVRPNIIRKTVDKPGAQSVESNSHKTGTLDDDDDEDDDDDDQAANHASPLMVYVRPTTAMASKGQDLFVAIFVNGNGEISSSHIAMNYDPNLLEVKGVRDSGMLSAGARAELQFTAEGGLINIQMDRPPQAGAVPARGQLCLIVFTVKATGQSPLLLNEQATFFRTLAGQNLPIKVQSSQVEIR